jgi:hypothetical protein
VIADVTLNAFNQLLNFAVAPPAKRATMTPASAEQTIEQPLTGDKHCGNGEQR